MNNENENCRITTSIGASGINESISFNGKEIPEELKERLQWVLWKLEQGDGRLIKVPYTVKGYRASVTNPETWTSYEAAYTAFLGNGGTYSGLGFVLTGRGPFIFFDWDDVRNPATGEFKPGILEEIISLQSYAEVSQSSKGVHVIAKGTIPGPRNRSGCREMYTDGRFVAITGNHIEGTPLTVNEAPESAINAIYQKIDPAAQKSNGEISKQKQPVLKDLYYTDEEIIHLCENSANGEKFKELFSGKWEGHYKSQSEADLALSSLIAFHTRDPDQINCIFKSSGLYRDKWDSSNGSYRTNTIEKALSSVTDARGKSEVPKQETVLREPYIITKDRIYLNVIDCHGHHVFAHLGDNSRIEYAACVTVDGRVVHPQELPLSKSGKTLTTVGIPQRELIESSPKVSAKELFELIEAHLNKYIDLTEPDIEVITLYILFTWFYSKLNTTPCLVFRADTGKGKTRIMVVSSDLCFYPITAGGSSTASGIMRFNEQWHGTLRIDEFDIKGGMENDIIKYFNLGFERGNYFLKTNGADLNKQDIFDPFGPKVTAMRKPFQDNATEGRSLVFYPRETTRKDIPIILPPEYKDKVESIRAIIARFVLENWAMVDGGKTLKFDDVNTEPRLKQLAIPISIVLQLLPDIEERFRNYILHRQKEVTKTRSESWEGMLFNYVYSLAIGDEEPVEEFKEYVVEGKIAAIPSSMVAKKFSTSTRSVSGALISIGMRIEQKTVMILKDGKLISKKTRMYVVSEGAVWREMARRYLSQDSGDKDGPDNVPECPDVLKAKGYHE